MQCLCKRREKLKQEMDLGEHDFNWLPVVDYFQTPHGVLMPSTTAKDSLDSWH